MASLGKRKQRVRVDESLITDFLDLRDSSIVQTGPKRPRGGGVIPLTPAVRTPLPQRRQKGIPSLSSNDARKKTPLTATVRDLIESAAEVSELTPGPSTRTTLTPTPARTPRRSPRLSVPEPSATDRRVLRSALKRVRPLSTLRKSVREGDSRVSFGKYVTVNEYSPEYGHGESLTSVERDEPGAGDKVLEPLEEEGSEEEGEGMESEGSDAGGEKEEEAGGGVVGREYSGSEEEGAGESEGGKMRGGSEEEEGARESEGGEMRGGSEEEEGAGESEGGEMGGGSEEEEGAGESEGGEMGGGSEAEEGSDEEESEMRLKTPHTSSQKAGKLPQLTTPTYSDFRPVRKSKPSPIRRRAPTRQPGKQRRPVKTLPRSLIKNLFTLFCKRRVTKDAMDLIVKFTEVYLKQASEDLVVFARHAGRKTIEVEDVTLLLGRQRHISESQKFEYLVNTYLPLEYVEELLPCAVAGKRIVPHMKT